VSSQSLLQLVPVGGISKVVHSSPQLLTEYFRDPERTAAAFEGGWFHSGDLGVMDSEGYLTIVDRKHHIKHILHLYYC